MQALKETLISPPVAVTAPVARDCGHRRSRRSHRTPVWLLEAEQDSRLTLPNAHIVFVEEVCLSGEAADQEARAELKARLIDAVAKT